MTKNHKQEIILMKNEAPGKKALIANAGETQANSGHSATLLPPVIPQRPAQREPSAIISQIYIS